MEGGICKIKPERDTRAWWLTCLKCKIQWLRLWITLSIHPLQYITQITIADILKVSLQRFVFLLQSLVGCLELVGYADSHNARRLSIASSTLMAGAFSACFMPLRMDAATLYDSSNLRRWFHLRRLILTVIASGSCDMIVVFSIDKIFWFDAKLLIP